MKIIFSKHAEMKIKERKVKKENIEEVLRKPNFIFYDLYTKGFINIGRIQIENLSTNIVVVYTKEEQTIKVITVYPCSNVVKEIKKKGGRRWIRVK